MTGKNETAKPTIGIALGSGSARGWSHIGVLQQLSAMGIEPHIVCGTSIGALVGAAYIQGRLDVLGEWVCKLDSKKIVKFLDINLMAKGGFIEGKRLTDFLAEKIGNGLIEDLPKPFATVASDLKTGRELWIKKGSVMDAIRSSFALPGIFTPVKSGDNWLVDGGLVNPVPVSLCKALGAEIVIAVNINGDIVGKHLRKINSKKEEEQELTFMDRLSKEIRTRASSMIPKALETREGAPSLFEVVAGSLNIMQDRITRSRMAGDPADVVLTPRLAHMGLLEFDRGEEAIVEGRESVKRSLPALQSLIS